MKPKPKRPKGAPRILRIGNPLMLRFMDHTIRFVDGKGATIRPPGDIATQILAHPSPNFPELLGVTQVPILRMDRTTMNEPGYDPETCYYYDPPEDGGEYEVPERPTRKDAAAALEVLLEPCGEFPHKTPTDRFAQVACVLTMQGRGLIPGSTPLFSYVSPGGGNGKTKEAKASAVMGIGRLPTMMPLPDDEAEMKKVLGMLALEGDSVVLFDNISGSVSSDALEMAITSFPRFKVRLLGETASVDMPWWTVCMSSGNNTQWDGTMARRVIEIMLDAEVEFPEDRIGPEDGRAFIHDNLEDYVKGDRLRFISAGHTMLKAHFQAGSPRHKNGARVGSFEPWDDVVRSAMIWVGGEEADPCPIGDATHGRGRVRDRANNESERGSKLFTVLRTEFSGTVFTVDDIAEVRQDNLSFKTVFDPCITLKKGQVVDGRTIGNELSRLNGRIHGELRLEKQSGARPKKYMVVVVEPNKETGKAERVKVEDEDKRDF